MPSTGNANSLPDEPLPPPKAPGIMSPSDSTIPGAVPSVARVTVPEAPTIASTPPISTPDNPFKATGPSGNAGQNASGDVYRPQDQSVESRIPGLLSTDNPIVQTQIGQAQMAGQARGLQNSTMTVEAGQKAAEASVLPIALQDSSQVAAQNLSAQNAGQSGALQTQQLTSQGNIAGAQIASTQAIANAQLKSQQQTQQAQIDAQNAQLAASMGSQATLAAAQIAAQKEISGQQLNAQEKMLVQQLNAAKANLTQQLNTTQQQNAQAATAQFAGIYQDAVNQINNNKDMTADARAAALKVAKDQYNSNMNLVQQMFGVSLTWTTTAPADKPGQVIDTGVGQVTLPPTKDTTPPVPPGPTEGGGTPGLPSPNQRYN